jgi:hypothetical protein
MAKRTNRVAWGLVVVLALVLLVGCVIFGEGYPYRTPKHLRPFSLLHPQSWRFGKNDFVTMVGPTVTHYQVCYYYGFFVVRLERRPPASVLAVVKRMQGPMPSQPSTAGPGFDPQRHGAVMNR